MSSSPTDPFAYTYPSPLAPYHTLHNSTNSQNPVSVSVSVPALPETLAADGKSYVNPPRADGGESESYARFVEPLDNGTRGGFDVHVYYFQENVEQKTFGRELWERIRREFPELRIYKFWEKPVGPHPIAMFEVNLFTPAQFGAFIPWLVINRGPLSVLIHPNTVDPVTGDGTEEERNHTQRATWMGERLPLDTSLFKRLAKWKEERKSNGQTE